MAAGFYAGSYTATWNGADIGRTTEGFTIKVKYHKEEIKTDDYGEAVVDTVIRGCDTTVTLDFADYASISAALHAQAGTQGLANAKVGYLGSTVAKQLVLTKIAGTNAPEATWTFPLAIVDGDIDILLASKLRKGPATFLVLPTLATGYVYTKS